MSLYNCIFGVGFSGIKSIYGIEIAHKEEIFYKKIIRKTKSKEMPMFLKN